MFSGSSKTYDLRHFRLSDMVECAARTRRLGEGAESMEEVAGRITSFLYDVFIDADAGGPACALVRLFKTHPFGDLPPQRQAAAEAMLGSMPRAPWMKCLTLLATRGQQPEWNDVRTSRSHAAIPLPSEQIVGQAPMIARLIEQMGVPIGAVLQPQPDFLLEAMETSYNVFHVEEAFGSPYIPAQEEFVRPYRIRSVVGFGGLLPSGNLFATVLFTRVPVPHQTAEMFRSLALNVKLLLLPFAGGRTFNEPAEAEAGRA